MFGNHPDEKVTVELKDKAAILSGRIFDAGTGRLLRGSIGITNLLTDGGRGVVAEKGKFQELVPANVDLSIMVEYVPRDRTEWSIFTTRLILEPGQKMTLDVPLFRKNTSSEGPEQ